MSTCVVTVDGVVHHSGDCPRFISR